MPPPDRVFRAEQILGALIEKGVEFVVIGGLAVQAHGYIRLTQDLDIVLRPDLLNVSRLSEALIDLQAEPRATASLKLTNPHKLLHAPRIPVLTHAGPLDIVNIEHLAGAPKSYDALRDAALVVNLDGVEVPFAGLADLIRMKRAAGRDQDLADIEALTRDAEST
jgi:hypothetical protein